MISFFFAFCRLLIVPFVLPAYSFSPPHPSLQVLFFFMCRNVLPNVSFSDSMRNMIRQYYDYYDSQILCDGIENERLPYMYVSAHLYIYGQVNS